ncbi:hypothetical protein D3C73_1233320 [compost metagenome]
MAQVVLVLPVQCTADLDRPALAYLPTQLPARIGGGNCIATHIQQRPVGDRPAAFAASVGAHRRWIEGFIQTDATARRLQRARHIDVAGTEQFHRLPWVDVEHGIAADAQVTGRQQMPGAQRQARTRALADATAGRIHHVQQG